MCIRDSTYVLGSQIAFKIPISETGIPITAQTLVILCWSFFLTPKEAFISIALYILLGALGLPVFADASSGIEKITGNSGGFIIGFLIASVVVSFLNTKIDSNLLAISGLTLLGTFIIVTFGVARLSYSFGFEKALEYGFYPFWIGAVIKIFLGSLFAFTIKKLMVN